MSYSDRRGLADKMAYLVVIFGSGEILHSFSNPILEIIIPSENPTTNSYLAGLEHCNREAVDWRLHWVLVSVSVTDIINADK